MLSELLKSVEFNQVLPLVSLIFFFVFFVAVVFWTMKLDKKVISESERLPLEDSSDSSNDGENNHA